MGAQVTVSATQIDKQRLGYQAISLTHFTDTSEPSIAAGSKVEVGGALYEFTGDETGTGWSGIGASNTVYLYLVPSGASIAWIYSTTAPTWDTAKQGWYNGNNRAFSTLYKDGSSNYTAKQLAPMCAAFPWRGIIERILTGSGNWAVPLGVNRIRVTCVGGGGGGGEGYSSGNGNVGSAGSQTTFAGATTGLGGGAGGGTTSTLGGAGGVGPAGGAGDAGGSGGGGVVGGYSPGGKGGGAGGAGGLSGVAGSDGDYGGGGGGGGGAAGGAGGAGGGGGGTIISLVTASVISVTPGSLIAYSVGGGGAGGTGAAGANGGAGGSGIILIEY